MQNIKQKLKQFKDDELIQEWKNCKTLLNDDKTNKTDYRTITKIFNAVETELKERKYEIEWTKETSYEDVQKLSEELEKHASMEGTEAGEYWEMLAVLNSRYFCMSPQFYQALKLELEYQLQHIKDHYELTTIEFQSFGETVKKTYLKYSGE